MNALTDSALPIGIFDSGVGGLTVCRRILEALPGESVVYLGDTARVPYGSKSPATVVRYALSCARILVRRKIKMLIVACNTASAFALEALREHLDIPVVGVVEPGARAACSRSKTLRIGVIGTRGVVASGIYPRHITALAPDAQVFSVPCPLFVPFAEEGWLTGEAVSLVARSYLEPLLKNRIDTLVLGCTHYPLLRIVISATVGPGVVLVDSARETAAAVEAVLLEQQLLRKSETPPQHVFLVSDAPDGFAATGSRFLGYPLEQVEWVDVCDG